MDNFVRIEKPSQRQAQQKPSIQHAPSPKPPLPTLEKHGEVSPKAKGQVDVSQLTEDQVEDILRTFDLNPAYGPFVGVDRSFRWDRAQRWGLDPPSIVKEIFETRKYVEQRKSVWG